MSGRNSLPHPLPTLLYPPGCATYPGNLLLLVLLHGQEAGAVDGHHNLLQGGQQLPGLLALAVRERPSARQGPGAGPGHAPVTIVAPAIAPSAFSGNGPPTRLGRGLGSPQDLCWHSGPTDRQQWEEGKTQGGHLQSNACHSDRLVSKIILPSWHNGHRACENPNVHKGQPRAVVAQGLVYVVLLSTVIPCAQKSDLGPVCQEAEGVCQVCPALGTCPHILWGAL